MSDTDSSPQPKRWVIVPAAGIGSRMGTESPKQYLRLAGKTLLEHTLERLLEIPRLEAVLVPLHPEDHFWHSLPIAGHEKIIPVPGGRERSDSVLNAMRAIAADDQDWVLVHDAARPCVRVACIARLIEQLQNHPVGGILGVPVADTLKRVESQTIETTVDRGPLWQAQTPQMMRYGLLRQALEQALADGRAITDEASALEHIGYRPKMVAGRRDNIKVTHPEDLAMAEMILRQQREGY